MNQNVFSRRLKAVSVEFGLRTGSGRLFQADGPAMAKARPGGRTCLVGDVTAVFNSPDTFAGRSGLVVARLPAAREGPCSNRAADKSLRYHEKLLRYAALGTGCTLTAVSRSTQPSTLRGTVNEYQPYG